MQLLSINRTLSFELKTSAPSPLHCIILVLLSILSSSPSFSSNLANQAPTYKNHLPLICLIKNVLIFCIYIKRVNNLVLVNDIKLLRCKCATSLLLYRARTAIHINIEEWAQQLQQGERSMINIMQAWHVVKLVSNSNKI